MANMNPVPVVPPPMILFGQGAPQNGGAYGISFDLLTRKMKDNLPMRWNLSDTRPIYSQIKAFLLRRGFQWTQYSVYQNYQALPVTVWTDMMRLRTLIPPGIFPTVVREIQMFHVLAAVLITTADIQLGGIYSPALSGPTPAGQVPPQVPSQPPNIAPNPLPRYISNSAAARQAGNWRV